MRRFLLSIERCLHGAGLVAVLAFFLMGGELWAQEMTDAEAARAERGGLLDVDEAQRAITDEAQAEILSFTLQDKEVSLFLSGYWNGSLTGTGGFRKGPLGFSLEQGSILFAQEPNLTLSLWIVKKWFVEAVFEEGYEDGYGLSSYRVGYKGGDDDFVQYAVIGNKGLEFPDFTYLDLGGDTPLSTESLTSSVGFYGRFGTGALKLHSLVRYDAAEREERIFSGGRERTYSYAQVAARERGISFVLPHEAIGSAITVYIEDNAGAISGGGTKWRIARPGEYAASARMGVVELAASPSGKVAVSYGGLSAGAYDAAMGFYGGSGFLAAVQGVFSDAGGVALVDLCQYPQCGQADMNLAGDASNRPGVLVINGWPSLVIYEKGTFSPFERQSLYKAPSSNAAAADLVNSSTGERIGDFNITERTLNSLFSQDPLYVNEEPDPPEMGIIETKRSIYEISRARGDSGPNSGDLRAPENRWPLAKDAEGIPWNYLVYLQADDAYSADVSVRWTQYGADNGFYIGSDVVPGSVELKRSGVTDPNFSYDPSSGRVSIKNPPAFNEIIRISYLKRSSERRNGSLAAGIGLIWDASEHFKTETAIGVRWNMGDAQTFSEEGTASPGTVGLSNRVSWDYPSLKGGETLKADISLGLGYRQQDTTGLYRVAGMEGNEQYVGLSDSTSFLANPPADFPDGSGAVSGLTAANRAPLVYRNYIETDALGNQRLKDISASADEVSGAMGPYVASSASLGGTTLVAEFTLDAERVWTGFQSPLGNGNMLSEAREMEIPLRFYDFGPNTNLRLVAQVGALPDEDVSANENTALIVQKTLFPDPTASPSWVVFTEEPHIYRLSFTDEERQRLQNATYLRILVINNGAGQIEGRVVMAPPIIRGAKFAPLVAENGIAKNAGDKVATLEVIDNSLRQKYPELIDRLHPENAKQRALEIKYSGLDAGVSAGTGGRVGMLPLGNYKKLSFFIKGNFPANSAIDFIVAQGLSSLGIAGETALQARISAADLNNAGAASWTKVELRYAEGAAEVYAGGEKINAALSYRPAALRRRNVDSADSENNSAYIMVLLNPAGGALGAGGFSLDEIIMEDSADDYWINGGGRLAFTRGKPILSFKNVAIIENVSLDTTVETEARGNPAVEDSEKSFAAVQRAEAGITILGAELSGNAAYSTGIDSFWWNGGHSAYRSFALGRRKGGGGSILRLGETFFTAPFDNAWNHSALVRLDGNFNTMLNAESFLANGKKNRFWQGALGVNKFFSLPLSASLGAQARWTENTPGGVDDGNENYGEVWQSSWNAMMLDNGVEAERRMINGNFRTSLTTKPIGATFAINGNSAFSRIDQTTQSQADSSLGIPFVFGEYHGELRQERFYKRSLLALSEEDATGATAGNDLSRWFAAMEAGGDLLWEIPFYVLFDADLNKKLRSAMMSKTALSESGSFGEKYRFTLQFPNKYGFAALYLPRSIEAHIDRSIDQKYDTTQDILGTGGAVYFSAVNLFGAFGAKSIAKFYENDQFNTSLSCAVAIPKDNDLSWRVGLNNDFLFFGFKGAELRLTDTLNILASGYTLAFNVLWTSPAEKSLLGMLYNWVILRFQNKSTWPVFQELAQTKHDRLREENLELFIDHSVRNTRNANSNADNETTRWTLTLGHKSIVRITGRLSLNVFATLSVADDSAEKITSFFGSIGTGLNVFF